MEAVLKLQQALIEDYYKQFIFSINDEGIDFSMDANQIIYRGESYFEKDLDLIKKNSKHIIDDIKPLYINALSEIILKLSTLNNNIEKLNFLNYSIQLFNIPVNQLKKDFFIDEENSRYYAKFELNEDIFSFNDIYKELIQTHQSKKYKYDYLNFNFFIYRTKILSFLPFSLLTIAKNFINILNKKVIEIEEEIEITETNESKLKWNGKASHLGFLIGQLAELDYINTPKRTNGNINYTHFAKEVLTTFHAKTTESTLTKYLNIATEKAQETQRNFQKANFNIPHKKEVS